MSSGVDQLKSLGNAGKSVEERNIPWSQQVDEASYENLASPSIEDVPGGSECNMRFQNPPFNAKENENLSANNYRNRKSITHLDPNKKYGKISYNNSKMDDLQPNAWSLQSSKHSAPDIGCSKFTRVNRQEDSGVSENVDARTTFSDMNELKNIAVANSTTSAPKKTWASIASQPAKNALKTHLLASNPKKKGPGMPPPPMVPGKHDLDANAWDVPNNNIPLASIPIPSILVHTDRHSGIHVNNSEKLQSNDRESKVNEDLKEKSRSNYSNSNFERQRNSSKDHSRQNWSVNNSSQMPTRHPSIGSSMQVKRTDFNRKNQFNNTKSDFETSAYRDENSPRNYENPLNVTEQSSDTSHAVLEQLRDKNNYNPKEIDLEIAKLARFFVIKSYSEDDIHRSIKYEIWCSTDHGNKRLDDAYKERKKVGGNVLLFFSVNGSGHFCGVAQMITAVDYNSTSTVWSQDKWKGKFKVKWIYVKDVPNATLRHIRLETNDNKPVTNSRDTQEVPNAKGIEVLRILHSYAHATSIFDDFYHYEKKQEEEVSSKRPSAPDNVTLTQNQFHNSRSYNRQHDDWDRDRDRDIRNSAKYIGTNYRERNRSSYMNSFSEFRENNDNGRFAQRHQMIRKEVGRLSLKHSSRESDFTEDVNKIETLFRAGQIETEKLLSN